jgi:hypothetical protein
MTAEPFIIFRNSKCISVGDALEKIEKFTCKFSTDSASAILSKDKRLSRPSDDSIEKLKVMIVSIKEQSEFHKSEISKLIQAVPPLGTNGKKNKLVEVGSSGGGAKKKKQKK